MSRIIAIVLCACALSACGGWGFNATSDEGPADNKPGTAVQHPPRCFTVDVHKWSGWGSEQHISIGHYCRVEEG